MSNNSRTIKSIRNAIFNILGLIFTIVSGFIVRTVFIRTLSAEYLGVNGLFTNILSLLSLAELGIGNAIVFKLYKPLANDNKQKIRELMNFYKRAYTVIGISVVIIGLLILPFLKYLIKSPPLISENLYIIYLLYLTNSASSYFFIYKRSLIIADQKEYISIIIGYGYTLFVSVAQIFILLKYNNFLLYLVIQIISTIIQNIIISIVCNHQYKYLQSNKECLPKEERNSILKDVRALFLYRISNLVINSTDNLIISSFIGISTVGLYSNYNLIIKSIYSLTKAPLNALTASIGNLNASEDIDKQYLIYKTTNFISAWLYGLVCIGLYVLINPFIKWWVGSSYLLDKNIVVVLITNFYLVGISGVYNIFRNTFGLFIQGQIRPVISSIINLVASLVLVKSLGVFGVFLGTTIAYVSFSVWYDPYVVHKHALKKSVVPFYIRSLIYIVIIIIATAITTFACSLFFLENELLDIVIKFFICLFIGNGIFVITYLKTEEFRYLIRSFKQILRTKKVSKT